MHSLCNWYSPSSHGDSTPLQFFNSTHHGWTHSIGINAEFNRSLRIYVDFDPNYIQFQRTIAHSMHPLSQIAIGAVARVSECQPEH